MKLSQKPFLCHIEVKWAVPEPSAVNLWFWSLLKTLWSVSQTVRIPLSVTGTELQLSEHTWEKYVFQSFPQSDHSCTIFSSFFCRYVQVQMYFFPFESACSYVALNSQTVDPPCHSFVVRGQSLTCSHTLAGCCRFYRLSCQSEDKKVEITVSMFLCKLTNGKEYVEDEAAGSLDVATKCWKDYFG